MKKMVWLLSLILCVTTFFVSGSALAESVPVTINDRPIYIAQATQPIVDEDGEIWKQSSFTFTAQGGSVYHGSFKEEDKPIWTLLNGSGERTFVSHVYFDEWYNKQPTVIVSLTGFDDTSANNKRIKVQATNVTEKGFDLVLSTWGNSKIYSLWANWVAFGNNG